jgi:hypothetical protein
MRYTKGMEMENNMTNLSPAAQAVLDAFTANWQDEPLAQDRQCLAAALRAAAKFIDAIEPEAGEELLAIAAELEGA